MCAYKISNQSALTLKEWIIYISLKEVCFQKSKVSEVHLRAGDILHSFTCGFFEILNSSIMWYLLSEEDRALTLRRLIQHRDDDTQCKLGIQTVGWTHGRVNASQSLNPLRIFTSGEWETRSDTLSSEWFNTSAASQSPALHITASRLSGIGLQRVKERMMSANMGGVAYGGRTESQLPQSFQKIVRKKILSKVWVFFLWINPKIDHKWQ